MLRGHGAVVIGDTIESAYLDLYTLELACRRQVLAMSTGCPLRPLGAIEVAEVTGSAPDRGHDDEEAGRHFGAIRELVDGLRGRQPLSVAR